MADPGPAVSQPGKPLSFSVNINPIGNLFAVFHHLDDPPVFEYLLFTSEPANESAAELNVLLMHQLEIEDQPLLFSVARRGDRVDRLFGVSLVNVIQQFLAEIDRRQQPSAFESSDAIAGRLTLWCNVASEVPRPAAAPRPASAADEQGPAPSGQQQDKEKNPLLAAANLSAQKFWTRVETDIGGGILHLLVVILHLSLSGMPSCAMCVCRRDCVAVCQEQGWQPFGLGEACYHCRCL